MPENAPRRKRGRVRRRYHHGDLEAALVRAAIALVEKRGAEAFSLREASARCGVVVSSAYRHFKNRGELLRAVADRGFLSLTELFEEGVRGATGGLSGTAEAEARLVALGRAYILFATRHPNLFRLMFGPQGGGGGDPRPDAPSHRTSLLLRTAIRDVLAAHGHADRQVDSSQLTAWSAVHGFSLMVIEGLWKPPSEVALEGMIARLGESVLRSLRS